RPALVEALQDVATITVVAPSRDWSAAAQSLTLRQPIYCDKIAEREHAIEGTPADAMILALHTLLKQKPDLVVSGINRGGNVGENVYYSGTVGAAMEAAINRVPAVAVSVAYRRKEFDYAAAAQFTRGLVPPGVDPRGRQYYWLSEQQFTGGIEPDTDHAAIRDAAISITPLAFDL